MNTRIISKWLNEECGEIPRKEIAEMVAQVPELLEALEDAKLGHNTCEDCWYSCPMSPEGCCDDRCDDRQDECNCGADSHNEKIDKAIKAVGDN